MRSFYALVDQLNVANPERRLEIEQLIWEAFGVTRAILALDMSNFSLFVRRNGILPYLCKVRRMQQVTQPIVMSRGGEIVKYEADNLIAVFENCTDAVIAALEINDAAEQVRANEDPSQHFSASIGIDYGKFLLIRGADCFGDPVNRAHKLGEDLARGGEILVTREVHDALDATKFDFAEEMFSIAGIDLHAFRVSWQS